MWNVALDPSAGPAGAVPGGGELAMLDGYDFFLSYCRDDWDDYLERFVDDLSDELRAKLGLAKQVQVAFVDHREVELGAEWDPVICEALQTSRVIVPLYSPRFFGRPFCGKELGFFDARRRQGLGAGAVPPPVIKPIAWIPVDRKVVPAGLEPVQDKRGAPGSVYVDKGLKHIVRQKTRYRTQYAELVEQFAEDVRQTAAAHPLPRLEDVRTLAETPTLFDPGGAPAVATQATGPNHVRFVYVAASPDALDGAATLDAYRERGGPEWRPFFPADKTPAYKLIQQVLARPDLEFTGSDAPFSPQLEAQIKDAWDKRQIVVLLVDGYSLYRGGRAYEAVLQRLDQVAAVHWCVLVPWSEGNPDLSAKRAEVTAAIGRTFDFHRRFLPTFYREGIRSADDLAAAVREVLFRLKEEIRRKAELARPVPPGPARPVLSGPSRGA